MSDPVMTLLVDEHGVLHTALVGNIPSDRVAALQLEVDEAKRRVHDEYSRRGMKFKSLIDLSQFGGTYVPKAIAILADYMKSNKPYVEKSAAFGGATTTNLAANIVATLAGRDNLAFFKTEEEARTWLSK